MFPMVNYQMNHEYALNVEIANYHLNLIEYPYLHKKRFKMQI